MSESDTKGAFDRLVAGLNAEDRLAMLNRINQMNTPPVELGSEVIEPDSNMTLKKKLESESIFYKFVLWIRALFDKKSLEQLYGNDLINSIAKKVNHRYPGTNF